MIYLSDDRAIEVSILEGTKVLARQTTGDDLTAHIDIIYGPAEDYTTLVYRTQDNTHEWSLKDSRPILGIHVKILIQKRQSATP